MATRTKKPHKAFVVGRIGEPGSAERTRADAALKYIIRPAASAAHFDVARVDLESPPFRITSRIVQSILSADVVICDLTGRNPNVYYELGIAHSFNVPVVLLVDRVRDLPFDVKDEAVIEIGDSGEIGAASADAAARKLATALFLVISPGYLPANIVAETVGAASAFPLGLRVAVAQQLMAYPCYRVGVRYGFRVLSLMPSGLRVNVTLSYTVVNRTPREQVQAIHLTPKRPIHRLVLARIGDRVIDPDDDDAVVERGVMVQVRLASGERIPVSLEADVDYRLPDFDLLTSYLPATDMELTLTNPYPQVRFTVESLLPDKILPLEAGEYTHVYAVAGAVLPYQGLRLDWTLKGSAKSEGPEDEK